MTRARRGKAPSNGFGLGLSLFGSGFLSLVGSGLSLSLLGSGFGLSLFGSGRGLSLLGSGFGLSLFGSGGVDVLSFEEEPSLSFGGGALSLSFEVLPSLASLVSLGPLSLSFSLSLSL